MTSGDADAVAFARGEKAAFLGVYAAHASAVRRWVSRFFRSPAEQEEVAQEVWLMVHRAQTSFDVNRGPVTPWLRALTANRCRELLRAKGRRPDATVPIEDMEDALWLDGPAADETLMQRKLSVALATVAAGLPADEARVLEHGFGEGRSNEEVATLLNVTVRQAKYLKKKLVARLAASAAIRSLLEEWRS